MARGRYRPAKRRGETERGGRTPRIDVAAATWPTGATIVYAAAALYLGLGGRDVRDVLATRCSLAQLAERRGQSRSGLKRAVVNALRRTRGRRAAAAAVVGQVLDVAEDGWTAWQAMVERMLAGRHPRGWRADAA